VATELPRHGAQTPCSSAVMHHRQSTNCTVAVQRLSVSCSRRRPNLSVQTRVERMSPVSRSDHLPNHALSRYHIVLLSELMQPFLSAWFSKQPTCFSRSAIVPLMNHGSRLFLSQPGADSESRFEVASAIYVTVTSVPKSTRCRCALKLQLLHVVSCRKVRKRERALN
jgi:hypothetical protein